MPLLNRSAPNDASPARPHTRPSMIPDFLSELFPGGSAQSLPSNRASIIPDSVAEFLPPMPNTRDFDDDDDDDQFGRGNISPLSSPMSSRKCQSIIEPFEVNDVDSIDGGPMQHHYDEADVEKSFSWRERAEAAEAQLASREEELEEQLTERECNIRALTAQLAARDQEIAALRTQLMAVQAQVPATTPGECSNCKSAETAINSWLAAKRERGILTERSSASIRVNSRKSL
jgi:uncharacterized coiled-coil protein SlyX